MNKIIKSILLGLGLYILVTIPYIIYILSRGQMGIEYAFEVVVPLAVLCGLIGGPFMANMDFFNKK